jgi:acyl CoA:acetate/3-ketoacid CoA transferase
LNKACEVAVALSRIRDDSVVAISGFNLSKVLYVIERAVFRLAREGLILEEFAPGVDLGKYVLKKMRFTPKVSTNLTTMAKEIFSEGKMGLKEAVSTVFK